MEEHEDGDDDGHDYVDAETETNETSSLSEASPSPLVEDRPFVMLRAVVEHDFTSDNPKVRTTSDSSVMALYLLATPRC